MDGSKRVGFQAALSFLALAGWYLAAAARHGYRDLILAAAAGAQNKAETEAFLAEHCTRTP